MTEKEEEPVKVWIIQGTDYDDSQVYGVYSTEENAKLVLAATNNTKNVWLEIVEQTLDPIVPQAKEGLTVWSIVMDTDGNVEELGRRPGHLDTDSDLHWWCRCKLTNSPPGTLDIVRGHVWARDEKHATKITNDYRVRRIAEVHDGYAKPAERRD